MTLGKGYNFNVKLNNQHPWEISPQEAARLQVELARRVSQQNQVASPRLIAGADLHFQGKDRGRAAVVVLSYPELTLVDSAVAEGDVTYPYIPGLLAFREAPLLMEAWGNLSSKPDLLLVDGQGVAHPRRFGIACHLGVALDAPTIGCAKSRLIGTHGHVGEEPGSWAELMDGDEVIGCVLRTKARTNPLYVSVGHKIDLVSARRWALACCRGYRLPEPTRLAHQLAGGQVIHQAKGIETPR